MNHFEWAADGSYFYHYLDEQLLATVPAKSLADYRDSGWEVPDAPVVEVPSHE